MILLAPVTAIFIITEFKKINIKSLSTVIYGTIIGILLSSWYWIPAIFEQWMIQYQSSGSLTQYADQFTSILSIFDLRKNFNSDDSYLKVINIGTISLLTIFIGLYLTKVNKKIIFWLILIFLSIFFLTNYSLFIWNLLKPLQYVQYPWRFLWVITIASLLIMIYFISEKKIKELWKKIICFLFILGLFFTMRAFIATKGFTTRSDFDWYHPANDTGSSFNEHNPIWARGPYYFPDELMYVNASQSANLNSQNVGQLTHKLSNLSPAILQFDGRTISYEVSPDQSIVVLHKRLFYPGWEASLDSEKTEFAQDIPEYNGVLAVSVPAKKSTVNITFTGYTKTRRFAEILSLATFVWLCMYYLLKKLWQNS
jgi:hypothetical protein